MLKEGWAGFAALLWAAGRSDATEGTGMAEYESVHVHDYLRFTKLLTVGAIFCLIIGFIVLMIL